MVVYPAGMDYPSYGEYRHFKGGKYFVRHRAKMVTEVESLNDTYVVVYWSMDEDGLELVRPASEFSDLVEWPDGTMKRRFEPIPNVCEHCGGDLGGYNLGRLEHHVGDCPSFPF